MGQLTVRKHIGQTQESGYSCMGQLAVRKHIGQTQESGYSCMGQLAVRKINKNKAKVK